MPEILADLQARGLVETTDGLRPVRPFVRVGLCNFWPSFNRQDNFFAWMLLDKFDVLLVDAQQDEADFVFYSTFPSAGFDHAQVDRTRTPRSASRMKTIPESGRGDYAFWGQSEPAQITARQSDLPLWSLYVDWDTYA